MGDTNEEWFTNNEQLEVNLAVGGRMMNMDTEVHSAIENHVILNFSSNALSNFLNLP